RALSREDGHILWSSPIPNARSLAYAHGLLYATASDQVVALHADDGTVAWTIPADFNTYKAVPAVAHGVLYVRTSPDGMSAYDARTGGFLWTSNLGVDAALSAPVIVDGYLYFAAVDSLLHAYALANP